MAGGSGSDSNVVSDEGLPFALRVLEEPLAMRVSPSVVRNKEAHSGTIRGGLSRGCRPLRRPVDS